MIPTLERVIDPQIGSGTLACNLRKKIAGRAGHSSLSGQVELVNVSTSPIEIAIRTSPLQYLDLIVTDAQQRVVSIGHYGDLFSPGTDDRIFRLLPGEAYVGSVSLLATVPPDARQTGIYLIQAVYEWNGVRAVSLPYRLDWRPEQDE